MNPPEHRIDGKTCLITGANSGVGKATALGLAFLGGNIVIVCRNQERGARALAEIKDKTGNQNVELMLADLASMKSVRSLAEEVKKRHDKLHVLVNNAGEILTKHHVTDEGLERTFASDHLGHFLLTNLLLDRIKASAPARIINVTSEAHRAGSIHFEDLQLDKKYGAFKAYSQAKLANVLFTYELARRLEGTGVTVNCIHPGTVRTGFGHDDRGLLSMGIWAMSPFFISAERAARGVTRLAASPELEAVSGRYFSKMKEGRSSHGSYDTESAQRLWQASEELVRDYFA